MDNEPNSFTEKRASLRVDMEAESVRLDWINSEGKTCHAQAVCLDLARRGVLFGYESAFSVGELVALTFHEGSDQQNTIKGQVCRCQEGNEYPFHVALQLV
ncbi:PilZ domain-containing protein [Shewanella intestini]|uniref:PilZ domain-containing protein n=1 Tax=Shewanella intestini TaxID=2017544 RepID=A0ABS5I539_9GAMM|nr:MULTISPECIES: PilZ domain-containing protein [Shewanella]MBR9728943.1 PilZ domain-containing protein [Shewanella intestini]MRG36992.1 PilZ domain-containing protein [Shewanella sp. XMDDZSB0408]